MRRELSVNANSAADVTFDLSAYPNILMTYVETVAGQYGNHFAFARKNLDSLNRVHVSNRYTEKASITVQLGILYYGE